MKGGAYMNTNSTKFFVTVILLGLSLFTALTLESRMSDNFVIELVIIFITTIITAGTLFGLWIDEKWAYPLSTLVFAGSLLNLLWLFTSTEAFLTFAFGLLINVAGIVICILGTETPMTLTALETYEAHSKKKKKK